MPKPLISVVLARSAPTKPGTAFGARASVLIFVALTYLFCAEVAFVARAAGEEKSNVWPRTVGCPQPKKPVEDSNLRHDLGLYSVLPPSGASWCVEVKRNTISFFRNEFMGRVLDRPPPRHEVGHSFMAIARAMRGPRALADRIDLQRVVFEINRKSIEHDRDKTLIVLRVVETDEVEGECVKFTLANETRVRTGIVGTFIFRAIGYACIHPLERSVIVEWSVSERHLRDDPAFRPPLLDRLQPDYAQFLKSVRFH